MTREEKAQICALAAGLLAPPDAALVEDLAQDSLRLLLAKCLREGGRDPEMASPFFVEPDRDSFLGALENEYARLFTAVDGERISLVESTYKPWTGDKECGVVFAAAKGLVMGDGAAHLLDLYEHLALEIPPEFRSTPDHVVLELEFLALLEQAMPQTWIAAFVEDHLDWIPELSKEIDRAGSHSFYRGAVEFIRWFLQQEVKGGKVNDHGEKGLC